MARCRNSAVDDDGIHVVKHTGIPVCLLFLLAIYIIEVQLQLATMTANPLVGFLLQNICLLVGLSSENL